MFGCDIATQVDGVQWLWLLNYVVQLGNLATKQELLCNHLVIGVTLANDHNRTRS
jgi:hypothetical protein